MIELKRLKLINWHNFENVTFDCARLTYMIGVNAVGKTTILDAIRYCLTTNRNFNALGNKKSGRTLQGSVHAKQRGENAYRRPGHTVAYIGPQFYDEDTITDQPMRQIVAEIIREKALHALDAEIPHGIAVAIDRMKTRPGKNPIVDIDATIICERESHKGIIIGKQGAMLKKIGSNARYEIERMLESKVNLKLWVKVKKDWRDSDFLIKNFGYDKKEI